MVAQAQVVKVTQYVFPEGGRAGKLSVENGTTIAAGAIPAHIMELDMRNSKPIFEEGAIHSDLKYLWVSDLVPGSHCPSGLNLFVHTYCGGALPVGPQVFIHADERGEVSKDQEHYLFQYLSKIPDHSLSAPGYDHGEQFTIYAFERTLWAVKRTPKPKALEPAAVIPEPVVSPEPASLAEEQLKLTKAKLELIEEKKKLVQAQLELVQKQLEILRVNPVV